MGLLDDAIREHLDLKRRRGADPTEVERQEREVLGPVRGRGEPATESEHDSALIHDDALEHEPLAYDDEEWDDEEEDAAEPIGYGHEPAASSGYEHDAYEHGYDRAPAGYEPAPEPRGYEHEAEPQSQAREAEPRGYEREPEPQSQAREPDWHRYVPEPEPQARDPRDRPDPVEPYSTGRGPDRAEPYRADSPTQRFSGSYVPEPDRPGRSEETAEFSLEETRAAEGRAHDEDEDVLEETPDFLQDTPDHDRLWFEQRPPRDFDFDG